MKNRDDKCFQYAIMVALNCGDIESHPEIVSNIKPFINKYKSKGISYLFKMNDWKTFEKKIRQLLVIFCIIKKKKQFQFIFQELIPTSKNKKFYQ